MEEKLCTKCNVSKPLIEWNKHSKRGTQTYCRECSRAFDKEYYKHNTSQRQEKIRLHREQQRALISEYVGEVKKAGCKLCDEDEPCCLDFHHIRDKEFSMGNATNRGVSLSRVKSEIEKCVLVCSNCHRKIHAGLIAL